MQFNFQTILQDQPLLLKIFALISGFAFLSALIGQYFFALPPCSLCLMQRVPYILVIVLLLISFVFPKPRRSYLMLACSVLIINFALAGFHSGIEFGWWALPSSCEFDITLITGEAPWYKTLFHGSVPCDQVPVRILGFSFANLNMLLSGTLAFFGLRAFK